MLEKAVPYLKVAIVVLLVGLVVATAGLVRYFLSGPPQAPRTELERAVFAAEEAVRANPQDPVGRVKLSAAYLEAGSTGSAVEQAQFAVRLAPEDPSGYYALGLAQEASNDLEAAEKTLQKTTSMKGQLAPFYADAYVALARVQDRRGDVKTAIKSMESALKNAPENSYYLYRRGQLFERAEEWVAALADYRGALDFVPDYEEAREAYDRLAREHPDALKKLNAMQKAGTPEKSKKTSK
ncbi:MAG: hypothetical protein C4521_03950 [Actinobacteria bacterium]|nr:MAG: hypothetical protein C4521_03950 [Actinomycetota bacterium]